MSPFKFTDEMNEVSGYGGAYEDACRAAVCAGAAWFAAHPDADPIFVDGLPHNDDAEAIAAAIGNTAFTSENSTLGDFLSKAMFSMVMFHVYYIAKHGWNAYVAKMSAPAIIENEDESEEPWTVP